MMIDPLAHGLDVAGVPLGLQDAPGLGGLALQPCQDGVGGHLISPLSPSLTLTTPMSLARTGSGRIERSLEPAAVQPGQGVDRTISDVLAHEMPGLRGQFTRS